MARDNVTSLDVARRAGVSQSAVSRVFTPGASASRKTAEKVRKAMNPSKTLNKIMRGFGPNDALPGDVP